MNSIIEKRNGLLAQKVISGLEKRNMTGYFAANKDEALRIALSLIPAGSSIGWGGSVSIQEIGLKDAVCNGSYTVYNRDITKTPEERRQVEMNTFGCDYFLCSSNAVTEDGILVNIDGNSNRVASICYGPKHVIMIVGMNKIAKDLQAAIVRARTVAAPTNMQRFSNDTPCKKTGACADCLSPDTICCQMLVTRFSRHKNRIHVILVNDHLGF